MDWLDVALPLVLLSALSAACWLLAHRADPGVRLPLALFAGAYLLTTVLGAIAMGLTDGEALNSLQWGIDLTNVRDFTSLRYWMLLFAPLILPAATVFCLSQTSSVARRSSASVAVSKKPINPLALASVYTFFFSYCIYRLAVAGLLLNALNWFSVRGDYLTMMVYREAAFSSVGSAFCGIAYIGLPTLTFYALYAYRQWRTMGWFTTLCGTFAGTVLINMEMMQKSPTLLFFTFLGIGLIELKVLRGHTVVYLFAGLVGGVTLLQAAVLDQWAWLDSVNLLIFRMASSFPFYANLYPDVLPYSGLETGLHLIGLGAPAVDCWDVFDCMYPTVNWMQGSAPGPAHMRAYSQGGIPYALTTLVAIGCLLKLIAIVRRQGQGPLGFALYLQSLMFLYYLTQTSLRESLISCYGSFWAVVVLAPLYLLQQPSGPTAAAPTSLARIPTTHIRQRRRPPLIASQS